ncbi:EAL domain-containing response regulator [Desulfurispira natronophila]|uniref:Diguanylate cyclase (GGDEF)-like protein n=1 Tax=Desulfurispira natronophila TaxID=682562 RepID=A0A7W7Y2R1_9BACT|nr:EAL domain-containing response regulator [Desulfurispira natronophila]MBB5020859.1 diguanylate cyclase (GGDEF)-like protein [Desulfurispira natronophila]
MGNEQLKELKAHLQDRSILYVEDEDISRESVVALLSHFCPNVLVATNGKEGLDIYRNNSVDIVITDIQMPYMDGLTMALEIKKIDPRQHIIIVSAYNETSYFSKAIKAGVDGFILKPVDINQLWETLSKTAQRIKERLDNQLYRSYLEDMVQQYTIQLKDKSQELAQEMVSDRLTGLPNRIKLSDVLKRDESVTIILLNVDNFSHINTTYGYNTGDEALAAIADKLRQCVPDAYTLYRFASDEFVCLMPEMALEDARDFAQNTINSCFEQAIALSKNIDVRITFTMAIAHGKGWDLLRCAEIAMLETRQLGKNRIGLYRGKSPLETKQKNNIYWVNRLRTALEEDKVVPFYQPIVNNLTGAIDKFECLVRIWDQDEIISPFQFLERARQVGLIPQITQVVVEKAFSSFAGQPYQFSINIMDEDLREDYLVDYVQDAFRRYEVKPQQVIFEILEGASVYASKGSIDQLHALKDLGCQIALDDFGAEHSNFSRLLDLQADYIKIDGMFIRHLDSDPRSESITRAIINLASSLKMQTVAEFVCSEEVYHKVVELGISHSQGFYVGKPLPKIETRPFLPE